MGSKRHKKRFLPLTERKTRSNSHYKRVNSEKNFLLVILIWLSSCGIPYVAPESGLTAKLILDSKSKYYDTNNLRFAINDGSGCGKAIIITDQSEKTEYIIPANKQIFVSYSVVSGSAYCTVSGSFNSETDKAYFVYGSGFDTCEINVSDITENKKNKPIKLERAHIGPWTSSKICKDRRFFGNM